MDMTYDFRIVPPADRIAVAVDGSKDGAACDHRLVRRGSPAFHGKLALLRAFLGHPLLSFAIVAGIHWEALKLWLKGVGLRSRPAPPAHPVTFVPRVFVPRREV